MFIPIRNKLKITVAIPSTLLEDCSTLKEKTFKIGLIGRAFAIYRVDEVIVFKDPRKNIRHESNLIKNILKYLDTPQYLRKLLYPLSPKFKYVGLLPPLKSPPHIVPSSFKKIADMPYREGVVVDKKNNQLLIEAGLKKPLKAYGRAKIGERVTLYIKPNRQACVIKRESVPYYWGYKVNEFSPEFKNLRKVCKADLVIATTRYGVSITDIALEIKRKMLENRKMVLIFGAPKAGLYDMCKISGVQPRHIADMWINFIRDQGVQTVRTEEAIISVLAIINFILNLNV